MVPAESIVALEQALIDDYAGALGQFIYVDLLTPDGDGTKPLLIFLPKSRYPGVNLTGETLLYTDGQHTIVGEHYPPFVMPEENVYIPLDRLEITGVLLADSRQRGAGVKPPVAG